MPNIAANSVVVRRADAETRSETDCVASMTTSVLLQLYCGRCPAPSAGPTGRSPGSRLWRLSRLPGLSLIRQYPVAFETTSPQYSRGVGQVWSARIGSTPSCSLLIPWPLAMYGNRLVSDDYRALRQSVNQFATSPVPNPVKSAPVVPSSTTLPH